MHEELRETPPVKKEHSPLIRVDRNLYKSPRGRDLGLYTVLKDNLTGKKPATPAEGGEMDYRDLGEVDTLEHPDLTPFKGYGPEVAVTEKPQPVAPTEADAAPVTPFNEKTFAATPTAVMERPSIPHIKPPEVLDTYDKKLNYVIEYVSAALQPQVKVNEKEKPRFSKTYKMVIDALKEIPNTNFSQIIYPVKDDGEKYSLGDQAHSFSMCKTIVDSINDEVYKAGLGNILVAEVRINSSFDPKDNDTFLNDDSNNFFHPWIIEIRKVPQASEVEHKSEPIALSPEEARKQEILANLDQKLTLALQAKPPQIDAIVSAIQTFEETDRQNTLDEAVFVKGVGELPGGKDRKFSPYTLLDGIAQLRSLNTADVNVLISEAERLRLPDDRGLRTVIIEAIKNEKNEKIKILQQQLLSATTFREIGINQSKGKGIFNCLRELSQFFATYTYTDNNGQKNVANFAELVTQLSDAIHKAEKGNLEDISPLIAKLPLTALQKKIVGNELTSLNASVKESRKLSSQETISNLTNELLSSKNLYDENDQRGILAILTQLANLDASLSSQKAKDVLDKLNLVIRKIRSNPGSVDNLEAAISESKQKNYFHSVGGKDLDSIIAMALRMKFGREIGNPTVFFDTQENKPDAAKEKLDTDLGDDYEFKTFTEIFAAISEYARKSPQLQFLNKDGKFETFASADIVRKLTEINAKYIEKQNGDRNYAEVTRLCKDLPSYGNLDVKVLFWFYKSVSQNSQDRIDAAGGIPSTLKTRFNQYNIEENQQKMQALKEIAAAEGRVRLST